MIPLQIPPGDIIGTFFGGVFGGFEIAGIVLFLVLLYGLYKMNVGLAGALPVGVLILYGMWQSFQGSFIGLWVVGLVIVLGVLVLGIYKAINK